MVADVREPESDQVDFSDMLERFKQGIAENVSDEDHEALGGDSERERLPLGDAGDDQDRGARSSLSGRAGGGDRERG